MRDSARRVGFDWDEDQEGLLVPSGPQPKVETDEVRQRPVLPGKLGLFTLGLTFLLGLAYEKDMLSQLRGASTMPSAILDVITPAMDSATLPDGLLAYDETQAKTFLRGLRLADMPTLHAYTARVASDLEKSDPAMRPFFQDAQRLLGVELSRRGASAS
jgi:hypothetical protein